MSYIANFVDNMQVSLSDSTEPARDLETIHDFLTCLTVYCSTDAIDGKIIISWDGPSFPVKSGEIFKQIRIRKNTRGYDKQMVRLKRLELRKNGGYDIKATTNAAPFLLCADEVMFKKMFLRVRDPREDSKRIAYGQCVKAVSFLEIEENGRYPFLQMEVCAEKITAIDSKLIIHLDMPFRSAAFIKELVIHNCTWGHTRHQKSPLQVDTILELLGPSSTI
jgi:hypothetical protein